MATSEVAKIWQSPQGGRLAVVMLGLQPMDAATRATLDEVLAAQRAPDAIAQDEQPDPFDEPPEDV